MFIPPAYPSKWVLNAELYFQMMGPVASSASVQYNHEEWSELLNFEECSFLMDNKVQFTLHSKLADSFSFSFQKQVYIG